VAGQCVDYFCIISLPDEQLAVVDHCGFVRGPLLQWHALYSVLHFIELLVLLYFLLVLLAVLFLFSSSYLPLHPLIRHHYITELWFRGQLL